MTTYRKFWQDLPRTDFYEYFNDFLIAQDYAAADWTITTTEAGAGAATEAISTGARGGILVITNDAADNDLDFFQSTIEQYKFVTGKALEFECRFKLLEVLQADLVLGLQITDSTMLDVTDGIFFQKDDGDALLDFHVEKNNTATDVAGVATLVADTWIKVGFYYDGDDDHKIQIFVNDVRVGAAALTNVPDDEELAISFGVQNGEAVANVLSIDYIRCIQQR